MMERGRRVAAPPQPAGPLHALRCPTCSNTVYLPYGDQQQCPRCNASIRVFPAPDKPAIPTAKDPISDLERLANCMKAAA
jgi:uncharacterized paraquat-inducible protein A